MSILNKIHQKIFGANGGSNYFGVFGSKKNGTAVTTKNPATMQSLTNFLEGLQDHVVSGEKPPLEETNSLFYLTFYQHVYAQQLGNSPMEWDVDTEYKIGAYARKNNSTHIWLSLVDSNQGNSLPDDYASDNFWQYTGSLNPSDHTYIFNKIDKNELIKLPNVYGKRVGINDAINTPPTVTIESGDFFYWNTALSAYQKTTIPKLTKTIDFFIGAGSQQYGISCTKDWAPGDNQPGYYSNRLLIDDARLGPLTDFAFYGFLHAIAIVFSDGVVDFGFDEDPTGQNLIASAQTIRGVSVVGYRRTTTFWAAPWGSAQQDSSFQPAPPYDTMQWLQQFVCYNNINQMQSPDIFLYDLPTMYLGIPVTKTYDFDANTLAPEWIIGGFQNTSVIKTPPGFQLYFPSKIKFTFVGGYTDKYGSSDNYSRLTVNEYSAPDYIRRERIVEPAEGLKGPAQDVPIHIENTFVDLHSDFLALGGLDT